MTFLAVAEAVRSGKHIRGEEIMENQAQGNQYTPGAEQSTAAGIASFNSKLTVLFFSALGLLATTAVACAVILALTLNRPSANVTMAGTTAMNMPGMTAPGTAASGTSTSSAVPTTVKLKVIPSSKRGPDGKIHDAFTVTNFAVHVGQPVKLTIDNTDNQPHSITSPAAGVSIVVKPGTHTYTLVVDKSGRFLWYCAYPCDSDAHGWAMTHPGFMSGYITAA
jgi:plastocyanin